MIEEFAAAKINLALHVTGRRADGYHLLDSVVVFASVGDVVQLRKGGDFSLEIEGPFAAGLDAGEDNLALRAATAMAEKWPGLFGPAHIRLRKNLPVASGIGGGSADAAAVLRAMMRAHDAFPPGEELTALALSLGADVPVCLAGRACRMSGIGEQVRPIRHAPGFCALLANPGVAVSTAKVFAALGLEKGQRAHAPLPGAPLPQDPARALSALRALRNDLQDPARALKAEIGTCLEALAACPGARLARMSGSGATCLGLFDTMGEVEEAARRLRERHPEWWIRAAKLGDGQTRNSIG